MNDDVIWFTPTETTEKTPEKASSGEPIPFVEKPDISFPEAAARGISSGVFMNYAPQIAALSEASGFNPSLQLSKDEKDKLYGHGPIETIVGAGRLGLEKIAPETFGTSATERYEKTLKAEKERQAAAREQFPGTSLVSEVGGSMLNPASKLIPVPKGGQTFVQSAKQAAPASGAIGAVQGSGEGETWSEKGMNALKGLLGGSLTGGVVSGVLSKVMPGAALPVTGIPASEVVKAAERLSLTGGQVQVPKIVASENDALLGLTKLAKDIPVVSSPLTRAGQKIEQQIQTKIGDVAQGETRSSAGLAAKEELEKWIGDKSKKIVSDAYDAVDPLIKIPVLQPLDATRKVAQTVQDELNKSQKILGEDPAVTKLMNAVTDPNGLDYQGIKGLRTRIGQMMDDPSEIYKDAAPSLKRLYGALTDDLKAVISKSGGKPALKAFEEANSLTKDISAQREALLKITGQKTTSRSGDQIFDTLIKYAGSKGGTDVPKLLLAKQNLPPDAWETIALGAVDHLATNKTTNAFDPAALFRQYNQLSTQGKEALFGGVGEPLRQALDDLATIGSRIDRISALSAQQGSPEKKLATAAELFSFVFNPIKTTAGITAGRMFASAMAEPATAQSVKNWANAYSLLGSKPSSATANAFVKATQNLSTEVGGRRGFPSTENILNSVIGVTEAAKAAAALHKAITDMSPPPTEEGHTPRRGDVFENTRAAGGRTPRATGGAVNLMSLSKAAKKHVTRSTEDLLNESDDTVARALEVANKHI
jgi:hypothetical protein